MGVNEDLAPSFTQKPTLRQEDDGNRLVFECQLVANPLPAITWFRGETQLAENDRTTMKTTELTPSKYLVVLELDDVIETDAGSYKVSARNKFGEVAASINLNFSREFISFLSLYFTFLSYRT
jgi:hypothetical protein